MPERLTTTGRTYQDDPTRPPATYAEEESRTVGSQQTTAISDRLFNQSVGNPPTPLGENIREQDTFEKTDLDLIGSPYEGAAVVGSEEGLFSKGSADQGQVVIAGGVAGKAVTLSTGSVFEIFPTYINQLAKLRAREKDTGLTEKIQTEGASRSLPSVGLESHRRFVQETPIFIGNSRSFDVGGAIDDIVIPKEEKTNQEGINPKYKSKYYNRYLENRSCLIFIDGPKKIVLPFFENPRIEEKRVSNYESTTNPGGAIPFLFYKFTEFSNIKISFKMNAMHISEILLKEGVDIANFMFFTDRNPFPAQPNKEKERFFGKLESIKKLLQNSSKEYFSLDPSKNLQGVQGFNSSLLDENKEGITLYESIKPFLNFNVKNLNTSFNQALAIMLLWIYTIKNFIFFTTATGVTNAQQAQQIAQAATNPNNPKLGKTIIIKHGPVYYYLPCILINYEIKEVQNSTYDIESVMALNYEISLTLFSRPENWKGILSNLGISNDDTGSIILFDNDKVTTAPQQVNTGGP